MARKDSVVLIQTNNWGHISKTSLLYISCYIIYKTNKSFSKNKKKKTIAFFWCFGTTAFIFINI